MTLTQRMLLFKDLLYTYLMGTVDGRLIYSPLIIKVSLEPGMVLLTVT